VRPDAATRAAIAEVDRELARAADQLSTCLSASATERRRAEERMARYRAAADNAVLYALRAALPRLRS
jgi:hypothetical protein